MVADLDSFAAVVELWPTASELGRDLGSVPDVTVRAWKARGIPAPYWEGIVAAAVRRSFDGVTLELLSRLAAKAAGRRKPRAITPTAGAAA